MVKVVLNVAFIFELALPPLRHEFEHHHRRWTLLACFPIGQKYKRNVQNDFIKIS